MKYLSLCSGIEAASVAWESLGWDPVAFSEIEPFPSAVLKYRFPDVPNLGDMTKYKEWNLGRGSIGLMVGGTPCQSFSVAGLRKGLEDPRGNLMLTYGAIADHLRPQWLVWENVPGVLSSNGGRDFGTFLGMLAELGYGFAYRVLDAQYVRVESHRRAVPQRRRRVFVVGYLGDWRRAASVLFESESLCRYTPPRRKAGERVAPSVTVGTPFSRTWNDRVEAESMIPVEIGPSGGKLTDVNPTLDTRAKDGPIRNQLAGAIMQPYPVGNCLTKRMHKGINTTLDEGQTPVLASGYHTTGDGYWKEGEEAGTLRAREQDSHENVVCLNSRQDPISSENVGLPIGAKDNGNAVCFAQNSRDEVREMEVSGALAADPGSKQTSYLREGYSVRRLTPLECSRLQGFPDDWARIPWRGKEPADCPDGPQYKAYGNSMAVNVMNWLGSRIQAEDHQ